MDYNGLFTFVIMLTGIIKLTISFKNIMQSKVNNGVKSKGKSAENDMIKTVKKEYIDKSKKIEYNVNIN